ncbi:MAG: ribosomal protein S18-alanine N-acetyltransferase [Pyrinomonadaceae bacterium]|jgi:ribosomal-protein-alanine N-acetyltransferase|nr:ribosomal protein S18-alanine N-acetyltransferase [Pyrinomonadaceae bacterium]
MPLADSAYSDFSEAVYISIMTEHDLLEVVEIEGHSGLSPWGWAAYYAELQGCNRELMMVARVAQPLEPVKTDQIAGYIVARLAAEELHINNVAVRVEYRRRGIGSALLTHIMEEGQRLDATTALLEVRAGNSLAQALYAKCGFQGVGRRRSYYLAPQEDAVIMRAQLSGMLDSCG